MLPFKAPRSEVPGVGGAVQPRIARRRDAYPKGECWPDRPVLKAEVVTGATDRSRSVDIRGLGALDGGTPGCGRRDLTARRPRDTSAELCPILIAHRAETRL